MSENKDMSDMPKKGRSIVPEAHCLSVSFIIYSKMKYKRVQ